MIVEGQKYKCFFEQAHSTFDTFDPYIITFQREDKKMILADKIINERKKNGWSQEELAEQLSVSRQSVSKWEGAQAVPDLQKIIAMADIFGVSTDYLLKDEIEPDNRPVVVNEVVEAIPNKDVRRVSLEEANDFLNKKRENAPKIALGVSMCVLSPVLLIFLAGLSDAGKGVSEAVAATIGVIVLLVMVAVAVSIFIICGSKTKEYEFIEKVEIETAYGVDSVVKDRKKSIEGKRTASVVVGVMLCIMCSIPLIVVSCLELAEYIVVSMVCVLLIIVAPAVYLFVRSGVEWGSLQMLLQEEDYTVTNKLINQKMEKISGVYWGIVLAIFLGWSFVTGAWYFTWIVWPVAAILYGVVGAIVRATFKEVN